MILGIDIFSENSFIVNAGNYFTAELIINNLPVPGSIGEDIYQINGMLVKHKRLSGLGRKKRYNPKMLLSGMGAIEGEPSELINLNLYSPGDTVKLKVKNDIFLDQGNLTYYLGIRLFNNKGNTMDFPLRRPDIPISWFGRGQFYIDITEPMRDFYTKYETIK
ncbi:hypothetical protein H0A61_01578 [Koleobacter methoxysyntrophicus]|jgi:hypothetical protein|uniref:Uncharacterized protein n=1 Tax=Koleobacter methoxysyntrophicus TaxID=2751313 RepID=A0A8A0RNX8_9FIRM|nr:hypothetical protein [Koleobacter methoxysyntrophicus]QSQ09219.1 hypothetical protein H0A61_01578 [Koleobacter methoxysyntrophicus]